MISGTFAPVLLFCFAVLVAKLVIANETYVEGRGIASAGFVPIARI